MEFYVILLMSLVYIFKNRLGTIRMILILVNFTMIILIFLNTIKENVKYEFENVCFFDMEKRPNHHDYM